MTAPAAIAPTGYAAALSIASRYGIEPEFVYAAATRRAGQTITIAQARAAAAALQPLSAGIEVPSLTYQDASTAILAMYLSGYEQTPALSSRFANVVTEDARMVNWNGLGAAPRMREMLDERQPANFNTLRPYPITVRDWEASVEIPRSYVIADSLAQYALRVQQMGAFAKQHPDALVAEVIANAGSVLCYDGHPLVDTDHSEGQSGSQSNLLSSSGDDTLAHIQTDLATGIAAFQRFKDDRGENCRIGTMTDAVWDVVCRPESAELFSQLATSTTISGSSNGYRGRLRVTSLPELTTADEWYLAYLGHISKPLLVQYQTGGAPDDLQILAEGSEHAKLTMNFFYGTKGHYTVVPANWRYILKFA